MPKIIRDKPNPSGLTPTRYLITGFALIVLGYGLLTFSDPAGQNWPSHLSAFILLSGYGCIGFGLFLK